MTVLNVRHVTRKARRADAERAIKEHVLVSLAASTSHTHVVGEAGGREQHQWLRPRLSCCQSSPPLLLFIVSGLRRAIRGGWRRPLRLVISNWPLMPTGFIVMVAMEMVGQW
jgi:hypothetical protein